MLGKAQINRIQCKLFACMCCEFTKLIIMMFLLNFLLFMYTTVVVTMIVAFASQWKLSVQLKAHNMPVNHCS